ncbi:DNA primase [Paramicrobacterium chengjingii]|uniref:DNA primase n=1 Tax=Paramicrobacterium chengjingii TaxID=2769067 RepID=A0ABX6YNX6_9MICO|nr:DNA primase [Microbacterium chengjingii]QPZ40081.1 DNA primase [Microbacterium chengjingii]
MAGRIRQTDIEEVKSRTNIADIIGDYVTLKSAGIGSMKGLCPFHDERTPSFHVRPQVGFYHCFGCGESGDVISFLQKMDHVTFTEAIERLAARVGIELHYEDGEGPGVDHGRRSRLLAANKAAEDYFQRQLTAPSAEAGRAFLGERGFDAQAAARFGVGFAPKGWDNLQKHLTAAGFTRDELVTAGLLSQGDRGVYDRFRGRLVWPIRDVTGQTVGFGARRLFDDDKGPKYLNTPETPVYHKAQVLYGLDIAKRDISRGNQVVVVEGYTDVMACHLAGITTAVATCGTAFGVDHIKVIRRIMGDDSRNGEVVFTFDPDAAGQKAALRAFSEEKRFAAQTYVAVAPAGLDPCDLRLKRGDSAVRRLLEMKEPMFEFVIKQVLSQYNLDTVEGRVGALRAAAPIVSDIRDASLRPGYTRVLARQLGVDLGEVQRAVRSSGSQKPHGHDTRPPSGDPQTERPVGIADLPRDPSTRLERDALMAIVQHPTVIGEDLVRDAVHTGFTNHPLSVLRDAIAAHMDTFAATGWFQAISDDTPEPYRDLLHQLGVAPLPERGERELEMYVRDVTVSLIERDMLRRKAELLGSLQRHDPRDSEGSRTIQQKLVQLETERRRLRAG